MITKEGHDKSVDIWTVGVLTYELLSGKVKNLIRIHLPQRIMAK